MRIVEYVMWKEGYLSTLFQMEKQRLVFNEASWWLHCSGDLQGTRLNIEQKGFYAAIYSSNRAENKTQQYTEKTYHSANKLT